MSKDLEMEEKNTHTQEELEDEKDDSDDKNEPDLPISKEDLLRQIKSEYEVSLRYMKNTFEEWKKRLKLLANIRRHRLSVGDTLLFEIMQTVVASLYSDSLDSEWLPVGKNDEEIAENLNYTSRYDHRLMNKAKIDYEWIWDACFFSYGLVFNTGFNKEKKCPIFTTIDPMTFLYDTYATSINGDMAGLGRCHYMGHEIYMTESEIDSHPDFLIKGKRIKSVDGPDSQSIFIPNRTARAEALGSDKPLKDRGDLVGENREIALLEWFTTIKGEIYLVVLADNFKKIARFRKIGKEFPVVKRDIYPTPHSFRGISVPDLVEDKQRARAKTMNTSLEAVTRNTYSMHFFDSNKVKKEDLANYELDKFVPVDGSPTQVVDSMRKSQVNSEVQWILGELSNNAQSGTATPDIRQGAIMNTQRSATELGLIDKGTDTRYGLTAKIFGWSEREFWLLWYQNYKKYFKNGLIEKEISLRGPAGRTWKTLSSKNLLAIEDPDVDIISKNVANAQKMQQAQALNTIMVSLAQDPTANKRYALKLLMKNIGLATDEIERIYPKTVDELEASKENGFLSVDKPQKVELTQDHQTHLLEHEKAEYTKATRVHIEAHMKAMTIARNKPELLAPQLQMGAMGAPGAEQPGAPGPQMPQGQNFDIPKNIQTA